MEVSTELLAQSDDDAFRPADIAKPMRILVLHHFAYQLGPVGEQARNDSVDVIDGEHDATDAQRVHRRVHGPKPDRVGRVELVQLNTLPIGSPQHREGGPDILEPDQAPYQRPFDCRLALELEAQFDEERLDGFEIVDNDENVVHPFNRHIFPFIVSLLMPVMPHVASNDQAQRTRPAEFGPHPTNTRSTATRADRRGRLAVRGVYPIQWSKTRIRSIP